MHLRARRVQRLRYGQRDGTAHTAADHGDLLLALDVRGLAQRADEILNIFAFTLGVQLHRGAADDLENDIHGTSLAVEAGDGQRNALAVRADAQDDELAGLRLARHHRRFNDQTRDRRVELLSLNDLEHMIPLLCQTCSVFICRISGKKILLQYTITAAPKMQEKTRIQPQSLRSLTATAIIMMTAAPHSAA